MLSIDGLYYESNTVNSIGINSTSEGKQDLTTLNNKTQYLDTAGKLTGNLVPVSNNLYSLGDPVNRFQDLYCANQVYSILFKGVALRNPASNLGLAITSAGAVSLDASQYLGTADSICSFTVNGVFQKSNLTTTDITTLQNKTQYLDTTGKLTGNLLPINDNAYELGDINTRFSNIYANGNVVATSFRGANIVNPVANAGISINSSGNISFDNYNGTADAILKLDTGGLIEKSNATLTTAGDLTCNQVKTSSILNNTSSTGITISNAGIISLTAPTYDATQDGKLLSLLGGVITPVDGVSEKIYTGFTTSQSGGGTSNTITIYATKYNKQVTLNIPEMTISMVANANPIVSIQTNELPLLGTGEYVVAVLVGNQIAFCRLKNNVGAMYLEFTLRGTLAWAINPSTIIQPFTISYQSINNTSLGGGSTIWGTVPAFITPHNLTSDNSDPNFLVAASSIFGVGNGDAFKAFDSLTINGSFFTANNTYNTTTGDQITSNISPMPATMLGSWHKVEFNNVNKTLNTIKVTTSNNDGMIRNFKVARFDGVNWIDTGMSILDVPNIPLTLNTYPIPSINGGGDGNWKGIAIVISRTWGVVSYVGLKELDYS